MSVATVPIVTLTPEQQTNYSRYMGVTLDPEDLEELNAPHSFRTWMADTFPLGVPINGHTVRAFVNKNPEYWKWLCNTYGIDCTASHTQDRFAVLLGDAILRQRSKTGIFQNAATYVARVRKVRAVGPITERTLCHTPHGDLWAEVGDYILEDPNQPAEYPVQPEVFFSLWKAVE